MRFLENLPVYLFAFALGTGHLYRLLEAMVSWAEKKLRK